jgi:hypothetical protein
MAKRYEFTGETEVYAGHTLHRIRAIVDMPAIGVSVGDLGGWIESEDNLPHDGTAWVFPAAKAMGEFTRLMGGTFRGGAFEGGTSTKLQPLYLAGLCWQITITDEHMTIGCETHKLSDWWAFDDSTIDAMDRNDALPFWRAHKATLRALCAATGRIAT